MKHETALHLLSQYSELAKGCSRTFWPLHSVRTALDSIAGIRSRFPNGGSYGKAMRWLGFTQGVLFAAGVYTLAELKNHSKLGNVPEKEVA